ncbi:MAG: signal recognition particle receptor subunit alpha, partial [Deltaproteobacteria bacterium]|nr:signal recognition particle receptor subunit alpha [Deltaproteobacteria bacterium]
MLETVSRGFEAAREKLRGIKTLSEENIDEALRDVRSSLLEADVSLPVVRSFIKQVKERALGDKVETRVTDAEGKTHKVTPSEHFIAICEEELSALMGPVDPSLAKGKGGITSVLLLGLQGVGKTTCAAKLAYLLKSKGQKPLLVAADIYRPAAILQLQRLGESIDVSVHAGSDGQSPPSICSDALERAKREGFNAIIFDTAGRLAIDDKLMQELEQIKQATEPANTILVCDALMGRDAVNVAQAFAERLPLDGLVLTKLDGDARGGAAL